MRESGFELAVDILVTFLAVVGAVGFTVVGVQVDRAGLNNILSGALVQGAWELWMGTLALFVGLYLLGYRAAWPSIVGLRPR